eukprot:4986681-Amphidinium_carterae.2
MEGLVLGVLYGRGWGPPRSAFAAEQFDVSCTAARGKRSATGGSKNGCTIPTGNHEWGRGAGRYTESTSEHRVWWGTKKSNFIPCLVASTGR